MSKTGEIKKGSAEIRYLDPVDLKFSRTEGGFVSLRIGRKKYDRVHLYRAFPLSGGDSFISVREKEDSEIGIIPNLSSLSSNDRALIEEELESRYFSPSIEAVTSLKEEFGYTYWEVTTSAGACRFTVQIGQNAVLQLEDGKLLLTDVDGNRFELEDHHRLESKHQRVLELLL